MPVLAAVGSRDSAFAMVGLIEAVTFEHDASREEDAANV